MERPLCSSKRGSKARASFLTLAVTLALTSTAAALLPPWLQHAPTATAIEAALFRAMDLPTLKVLFPRPPAESVTELTHLLTAAPNDSPLLLLRAQQEEAALDLTAAERDLKAYAAQNATNPTAQLTLADFFHRRHDVADEFHTLLTAANTPASPAEIFQLPNTQSSWQVFERALRLANAQSLPATNYDTLWQAWLTRYPTQPTIYARAFTWNVNAHRPTDAQAILTRYKQTFPADTTFSVKASALLALTAGGPDAQTRALAVYDQAFQPLWPQDLLNSYFDLLAATHSTQRFVADAQAHLTANPEDLTAATRLFLYHRHNNHPDLATAVLTTFARNKNQHDPTGRNWSPTDLHTLAELATAAQLYPEAARYNFALYHLTGMLPDGTPAPQVGLIGMIGLLLSAPDQPIPLGAGNLGMYRDIATLDQGPGFLNGILSLWLNDQNIDTEFDQQETRATPYFHRAKAADLLTLLDKLFPNAPERPTFHAQLITAYATYGDDTALLQAGEQFLQVFPNAPERTAVALAMADADARAKNTTAEFALYDHLLNDLGHATQNMPLTTADLASSAVTPSVAAPPVADTSTADDTDSSAQADSDSTDSTDSSDTSAADTTTPTRPSATSAYTLNTGEPTPPPSPAATAYKQVLDRYIGRLTASNQLPAALAVLRKELDRNPNDPKLYERLADFLTQNNLYGPEEELYRAAIAKFDQPSQTGQQDTSWYDKLARFYLRQKRNDAYANLTRQITGIFSGTDLDTWFAQAQLGAQPQSQQAGPQLALQLNLYAHKRFPHDLTFTNNLLTAYTTKPTTDQAAYEHLLRQVWWQSPDLTTRFFAFLTETNQLDKELAQLPPNPTDTNPAALSELAQAHLWRSHFELSTPLFDRLAALYPTDTAVGSTAADLNRSLAWLDSAGPAPHITEAVTIEQRLLTADLTDTARLTRIGDILSDHADGTPASYAPAAAFWRRIPATAPGQPDTYLDSATVFWDYFQFNDALDEIHLARTHFNDPTLFGYEAGAILEGQRNYTAAIHEYTAAAITAQTTPAETITAAPDRTAILNLPSTLDFTSNLANDPSADRLLELARRPATAPLVDTATITALTSQSTLPALRLRLAVLDAQHRSTEAQPLLITAIAHSSTPDAAADLAAFAQKLSNTPAYEAALRREADLTPDPVEKLQLTYDLVRAYQSRNDLPAATQLVDVTYHANPRILGVVRFTVDFDWSNNRQKLAVTTLQQAASAAQPPLAQRFTAEASSKATESGDPTLGRSLALTLLNAEPYNLQYLSLAAQTYTRANDTPGLQTFYRSRLETLLSADMTSDQRRSRTALLRRGLIPALIAGKNYPAALDQYIALLSAFPEDPNLTREAALFAIRYKQQAPLKAFYVTTTQTSPRDPRFFIDLAQTEDFFGDPTAALDAYSHATTLRPERVDLFTAKAALEERLNRFDAAIADYTRLFQLTYKDPAWMVAAAAAHARQGETDAAVAALQTAYLHGAQTTPHDLLTVAAQLETWGMLPQAANFAEQAARAAGPDLLAGHAPAIDDTDSATYARILARDQQIPAALTALKSALTNAAASPSSPTALAAQVRARGITALPDSDWRKAFVEARQQRADAQYTAALLAISQTVATYGTPEDRTAYAALLTSQKATATRDQLTTRWLPAAHAADLAELEATWRAALLIAPAAKPAAAQLTPYLDLQHSRFTFAELAQTLDRFARLHPKSTRRNEAVREAADAYAAASQPGAEQHLLAAQRLTDPDNAALRSTYLELLLHRDTNALVALASNANEALADAAATEALSASAPVALAAVHARGTTQPAVWTSTNLALTGLYFNDQTPATNTAFQQALQPDLTIAQRLATLPDTTHQLTGNPWFYTAARYAQFLLTAPAAPTQADDLLPADLEAAQTTANYLTLAQTLLEAHHPTEAVTEISHALELDPTSTDALDAEALILWQTNHHPEAITAWRTALDTLRTQQEQGTVAESYWTGFSRIADHVHDHNLYTELQPVMTALLRSYLARNSGYRSNELLHAAFTTAPDPTTGIRWILDLSTAAPHPLDVLTDLENASWLSAPAKETLLYDELNLIRVQTSATTDDSSSSAGNRIRVSLLRICIEAGNDTEALNLIHNSPLATRNTPAFQEAEIIASARLNRLPALLQTYNTSSNSVPASDTRRFAVTYLSTHNNWPDARALLEWNYTEAEANHTLTAADSLNLAEARLHTNDPAEATSLLHTFVAASMNRTTDEDSAATLLEETHRPAEAISFLQDLATATPWDFTLRVRLAEAQLAAHQVTPTTSEDLTLTARSPQAPYTLRARAARDLAQTAGHPAATLGSAELDLLATGTVPPAAARRPFFVEARKAAADSTSDPKLRLDLLREALAITPGADDSPQLQLSIFRTAVEAKNPFFARAVLDILVHNSTTYTSPNSLSSMDDPLQSAANQNSTYTGETTPTLPFAAHNFSTPEKVTLAQQIATVYAATDDPNQAIEYLNDALDILSPDPGNAAQRSTLVAQRNRLSAQVLLNSANATRRPTIRKALDQPNVVRTRLAVLTPDTLLPTPEAP